ncbi:ABC transporter ATP-binding protein [Chelativorans sp. M5D2P16]|uniref:ABC transporter ATP-binding protein n=1 Tax=Chelativorans sp. M5D2P16 TaxID=3095678 RepID=UPI002AC9F27D|nr:ABC transporter ATP-binding protein [Chelativorans sp. M5D2P16]MDZ5699323.1 ABC transporter ATP-binding protein [Chelativorans sp. M5D2P16]
MTPLLATAGLSRAFGGLKAVDNVDFTLPAGESHAIIGPNGAGKTTFVNLVCGRIRPDSGSIRFAGRDVTHLPAHRRVRAGIAYTFQITSVFSGLSVLDNVVLAVQRHLLDHSARPSVRALRQGAMAALERVGLSADAERRAGALAYGHQRLLELAMALALEPWLLILDEPTQGLSDAEIEGFVALVREVGRESTVLLIEHNMDVVMALAARITVMDRGRILSQGTPVEIRADKSVQEAYLGG